MTGGTVSFHAYSSTKTAAFFAERVGVRPTRLAEIGDLVGNGSSGRRHRDAIWTLELDCPEDAIEPLDDALLRMLSQFDGWADVIDELRSDFDLRVRCSGSSDSMQGGFWLGVPVLQRLGRLGVDFVCTVYLDEPEA